MTSAAGSTAKSSRSWPTSRRFRPSAARAAGLVVAQAERLDRLFADLVQRVDETASAIQNVVLVPAREGRAVLAAITAAIAALRELRSGDRARTTAVDEEDPLFIG